MKKIAPSCWTLLEDHRLRASLLIGLTTLSGLLEGIAIISLVPILSTGLNRAHKSPSFLEMFGLAWDPADKEKTLLFTLICFFLLGFLSAIAKVLGIGTSNAIFGQLEKYPRGRGMSIRPVSGLSERVGQRRRTRQGFGGQAQMSGTRGTQWPGWASRAN